jgi:hypothetical protein
MSVKIVNDNNQEFISGNIGIKIALWDTYRASIALIVFLPIIFCALLFASIITEVNMVMIIWFPGVLIVLSIFIKFQWFSKLIMDMVKKN